MVRRLAYLATVAVALVVATGCTTGPDPATPGPSDTDVVTEYQLLDEDALVEALLPVAALPPGFTEVQPEGEADQGYCGYKRPNKPDVRGEKTYRKIDGKNVDIIAVNLRQFADADQAKANFDALIKALETCKEDTINGDPITYTVVDVPVVGQQTLGVHMELPGASVLQGFALVGPTIVATGTGSVGELKADLVPDLLEKQIERYENTATAA